MNYFYALCLTAFLALSASRSLPAQTIDPDYLDGHLYIKLQDTTSFVPDPGNIPALNTIFTTFGVDSLYKAFVTPNPLIDKVYRMEFSLIALTGQLINALEALSFVDYAEQVPLLKTFGPAAFTPDDLASQQWYLNQIDAPLAWNIGQGSNQIKVAIVDNAVLTSHEDLNGVIWTNPGEVPNNLLDDDLNGYPDDVNGYDVADQDNNPNPPANFLPGSGWSHGSHCAGIAGAETDNSTGMASIGFGIRIIPVKASSSLTSGNTLERGFEGVDYAISAGADVISMSWGGTGNSLTGELVMISAAMNGVVLVAAAGNNGDSIPIYPAAYSQTIAVGATDQQDAKSSFSNYGPYVDVMAPGSGIYSALATAPNAYGNLDGTSMACPLVAGLAGLLLSVDPGLSRNQVRDAILNGCANIDAQNPQYIGRIGAGRINAFNSLSSLGVAVDEPRQSAGWLRVYPNPADGLLTIEIRDFAALYGLQIRDAQGRPLLTRELKPGDQQIPVDLSDHPAGLYFVEVHTAEGRRVEKVVVR